MSTTETEKLGADPATIRCLQMAKKLTVVNAIATAVLILLFLFGKFSYPELVFLFAIVWVPAVWAIALANIIGLAGAVMVAFQCRRWKEPALLIAVSLPSLSALLYFFFWA